MKAAEVMDLLRSIIPADTAGMKRTKRAQTYGGGHTATKQRQQQNGTWCPVCSHFHRVGAAACTAASAKAPSLETRPISTGRRVNADRG